MIATQPLLGEEQGVIKIDGILTKKSLGGQKRNRQEKAVIIDNGNYYPIY
jgi:hypothetical protein